MDDATTLLNAIMERPDDIDQRLRYADWLEQHADGRKEMEDRADFIRVQLALADPATAPDAEGRTTEQLQGREAELLKTYRKSWAAPLRELGASEIEFKRGFPEGMVIGGSALIENADKLFALAPIRQALIQDLDREEVIALASSPHLSKLTSLVIDNCMMGRAAVTLAQSPHMSNLKTLVFLECDIGREGAAALASSPHLSNLERLDFEDCRIGGSAGAAALAASSHLPNLKTLGLNACGIGDEGERALAKSRQLSRLTSLNLNNNGMSATVRRQITRDVSARRDEPAGGRGGR